jgi:hypothetical protein
MGKLPRSRRSAVRQARAWCELAGWHRARRKGANSRLLLREVRRSAWPGVSRRELSLSGRTGRVRAARRHGPRRHVSGRHRAGRHRAAGELSRRQPLVAGRRAGRGSLTVKIRRSREPGRTRRAGQRKLAGAGESAVGPAIERAWPLLAGKLLARELLARELLARELRPRELRSRVECLRARRTGERPGTRGTVAGPGRAGPAERHLAVNGKTPAVRPPAVRRTAIRRTAGKRSRVLRPRLLRIRLLCIRLLCPVWPAGRCAVRAARDRATRAWHPGAGRRPLPAGAARHGPGGPARAGTTGTRPSPPAGPATREIPAWVSGESRRAVSVVSQPGTAARPGATDFPGIGS